MCPAGRLDPPFGEGLRRSGVVLGDQEWLLKQVHKGAIYGINQEFLKDILRFLKVS